MKKIAIVGNPNGGKSSLFNNLTGLNQKVGNFPGVTVDKKTGICKLQNEVVEIIDLPGTYNIFPKSEDEIVSIETLLNLKKELNLDSIIVVVDATNLTRNLLFFSQVKDLGMPVVMAITMLDIAQKKGIKLNINEMQRQWQVPVIALNPRYNKGTQELKQNIQLVIENKYNFFETKKINHKLINELRNELQIDLSDYGILLIASEYNNLKTLTTEQKQKINNIVEKNNFSFSKFQAEDTIERYNIIKEKLNTYFYKTSLEQKKLFAEKLDKILLHKHYGNIILLLVLFLVFQVVYSFAELPMNWIENFFATTGSYMKNHLPEKWWSNLIVNGIWAGLSGIAVFIPQIALLFGLINLLEDSGYMARISFLTDKILRKAGLSGRSAMPLISGFACAVPAIMSARTIQNKNERLITILITPLLSCSARLPVYIILIGVVIPDNKFLYIFNLHGVVLFALYILSILFTIIVAYILKFFFKSTEKNYFILELPIYRRPRLKNIITAMLEKSKIFVVDAGKIILIISIILWFLASFGPGNNINKIETKYKTEIAQTPENKAILTKEMSSEKLSNSYAGILGKAIEPLIKPLGFDWKIGIALISSFAAREVFVGTISTLYSMADESSENTIIEKMKMAKDDDGKIVYTLSTGLALLIFYVFAMQCMSTLAIVKRETKSWKWPLLQLAYMSILAYSMAYLVKIIF